MKIFAMMFVALAGRENLVASDLMPAAQQNALIAKYCAVCHTDSIPNGGLSLQYFDAARRDPQLAAMLASKLKAKALGAAGLPLPDRATQDALLYALSAESAGAGEWRVERTHDTLAASVVRQEPSHMKDKDPDLYRLTLRCDSSNRSGEMQLAWSPAVPDNGQVIAAAVDGRPPVQYTVVGLEKMGNGTDGKSGPGALQLSGISLPERTLTIRDLFPNVSVAFSFENLPPDVRQAFSACFGATP